MKVEMDGNSQSIATDRITAAGIRRVLAFRTRLADAPDPQTIDDFVQACHNEQLVQPLDWNRWLADHEAAFHDGTILRGADLPVLVRVITTHLRADRFNEGHLVSVISDGTLEAVLERLDEVLREMER